MATERLRQKQDGREEQAIRAEVHLALSKLFPDPSATEPSALTRHELKCAHAALTGVKPARQTVELFMKAAGASAETEGLPVSVFVDRMVALLRSQDPDERLRKIYASFDTQGMGYITRANAQSAFKSALPTVDTRVVDQVFDELDTDGDGRVGVRDFMTMMKQQHLASV